MLTRGASARVGVRVVVQVVVVAQPVDVGPAVQAPVDRVAHAGAAAVVGRRLVDALAQPGARRSGRGQVALQE